MLMLCSKKLAAGSCRSQSSVSCFSVIYICKESEKFFCKESEIFYKIYVFKTIFALYNTSLNGFQIDIYIYIYTYICIIYIHILICIYMMENCWIWWWWGRGTIVGDSHSQSQISNMLWASRIRSCIEPNFRLC